MGTRANIIIRSTAPVIHATLSHDGYPEEMLTLLVDFLSLPRDQQSFDELKSRYLGPGDESAAVVTPDLGRADFEYVLSRDRVLEVREWGAGDPIDPLSTVERMEPGYQEDTRTNINRALSGLADAGVRVQVGRVELNLHGIVDRQGLSTFL